MVCSLVLCEAGLVCYDLAIKIQQLAINSQIEKLEKGGTTSGKVSFKNTFGDKITYYLHKVAWMEKKYCGTDESFVQYSNDIDHRFKSWCKDYDASAWLHKEYAEKQMRLKRIRGMWANIKEERQLKKIRLYLPHSLDSENVRLKKLCCFDIKYHEYFDDSTDKFEEFEEAWDQRRVNLVDVNRYERYKALGKKSETDEERVYYLHQIAMLRHNNKYSSEGLHSNDRTIQYSFLGTYKNNLCMYHHNRHYISENYRPHRYKSDYIDFVQHLYMVDKYGELSKWDIYGNAFLRRWRKYLAL